MTLYQRLVYFYERDKFRFNEKGKGRLGSRLKALWDTTHPNSDPLPLIESIEDTGQYKAIDYPDTFRSMIDQLIRNVHKEILSVARERRLKEAQGPPPVIAPTPPQNKERKRIPAKQVPAWKGR